MSTTPEDSAAASKAQIHQPKPSLTSMHHWRHRGRTDVHGKRQTKVQALFSGNEDTRTDELPNEIVIEHEHGDRNTRETIRMDREAAQVLIVQLQEALAWDGKA